MKFLKWLETVSDRRPWQRDGEHRLTKSRAMNDGEVLLMLLDQNGGVTPEMRDAVYAELLQLLGSLGKAFGFWVASFALGLLSLVGGVDAASAAGVSISKGAFLPVALLTMSATSFWFAILFTKFSRLRMWFDQLAKISEPPFRAWLYLRYPEAFAYLLFSRTNIGYPRDVFPEGSDTKEFIPLLLIGIVGAGWLIGSAWLQIAMMFEVWRSALPTLWSARLIVVTAAALSVLGLVTPRPSMIRRRYVHYGLINLLKRADADRTSRAHVWIAKLNAEQGEKKL